MDGVELASILLKVVSVIIDLVTKKETQTVFKSKDGITKYIFSKIFPT